jgi:DNA-binding GntR family transcriptional regulator
MSDARGSLEGADEAALPGRNVGAALVSAQDAVYTEMRESILDGRIRVGQVLRQEEVAAAFGVSRVPIREALLRLATEGLVELRPRRGYVVASLDADEIEEIFDLRAALERRTGYFAAINRTEQHVAKVKAIVADLARLSHTPPDKDAWFRLNRQFHQAIFDAAQRKHLARHAGMLRDTVEPHIRLLGAAPGETRRAQKEHVEMLDALVARNARRLAALCAEHCAYTGRALLKLFRSQRARPGGSGTARKSSSAHAAHRGRVAKRASVS